MIYCWQRHKQLQVSNVEQTHLDAMLQPMLTGGMSLIQAAAQLLWHKLGWSTLSAQDIKHYMHLFECDIHHESLCGVVI